MYVADEVVRAADDALAVVLARDVRVLVGAVGVVGVADGHGVLGPSVDRGDRRTRAEAVVDGLILPGDIAVVVSGERGEKERDGDEYRSQALHLVLLLCGSLMSQALPTKDVVVVLSAYNFRI